TELWRTLEAWPVHCAGTGYLELGPIRRSSRITPMLLDRKSSCPTDAAVGAPQPPASIASRRPWVLFAIAQAIQRARSRLPQSDAGNSVSSGLIDRRRSGRLRLIPIIPGEVHNFGRDQRAAFAVWVTTVAAAMIIGSCAIRRSMIPSRCLLDTVWVPVPEL